MNNETLIYNEQVDATEFSRAFPLLINIHDAFVSLIPSLDTL